MRLLVKNIGKIVGIETAGRLRLCGGEMDRLETLDDAWLLADDGRIAAFGRMETLGEMAADRTVDAEGGMLFPSFCDSHTHLVYAGSREREFLDKLPVNQPYTMTVDQAVEAVKAIRPAVFYPYHYGEVEEKTDTARLARELEGVTEVRIRPME